MPIKEDTKEILELAKLWSVETIDKAINGVKVYKEIDKIESEKERIDLESLKLDEEARKIKAEASLSLVQGYPISSLAKSLVGVGIAMVSGSLSSIAFAYHSQVVIEVFYILILISLFGAILFISGIWRWNRDEKVQKLLYDRILDSNEVKSHYQSP